MQKIIGQIILFCNYSIPLRKDLNMRIFGGFGIAIAFIIWVIYRLYKKDLKEHMQAFWIYSSFVAVWAIIYGLMVL